MPLITTLQSIPAVAGGLAALPMVLAAAKGVGALRHLLRVRKINRTDWRWRLRRLAARASALAWLGGACWTLWLIVTG